MYESYTFVGHRASAIIQWEHSVGFLSRESVFWLQIASKLLAVSSSWCIDRDRDEVTAGSCTAAFLEELYLYQTDRVSSLCTHSLLIALRNVVLNFVALQQYQLFNSH